MSPGRLRPIGSQHSFTLQGSCGIYSCWYQAPHISTDAELRIPKRWVLRDARIDWKVGDIICYRPDCHSGFESARPRELLGKGDHVSKYGILLLCRYRPS